MCTFGNRRDCAVNSARTLFGLTHALRATRDAKKKETKNRTRPQDHAGRGGKTKEKRVRKASSDDHREGTSLLRETRLGVAHLTHNQVPAGTTPFTSLSLCPTLNAEPRVDQTKPSFPSEKPAKTSARITVYH